MTALMPNIALVPTNKRTPEYDSHRMESNVHTGYTADVPQKRYFCLERDTPVQFPSGINVILAARTIPIDSLSASAPYASNIQYLLYVDSVGRLLICCENDFPTLRDSGSVFYPLYREGPYGWIRWQPRPIVIPPVILPCVGINPMIQLVAGGNIWGTATDDTNGTVDGPLGTNMLNQPDGGVFGPDGKLYFRDFGTSFIRVFDPATQVVSTTAVSLDRGTGSAYREDSQVFAIGPDGMFYFFLNSLDDEDTPEINSANPDNSDGPFSYRQNFLTLDLGPISNLRVAPDNSCVYVPVPNDTPYTDLGTNALGQYQILRLGIDPSDGSCSSHDFFAGYSDNGVIAGIPSNQGAHDPNSQGEDVAALDGQVGNCVNCYVDPNGNLYTLCNETRMVRRIDITTGHIRSITNHVPLDSSGFPAAGGYNGDGLPAFTLGNNTPQFGRFGFNSVSVDSCDNVFVNDLQIGTAGSVGRTSLVRYVDTDGILHTFVGDATETDNTLPTTTPQNALTRTIYSTRWIAWGPDGCLYIIGNFFDGANVSQNAIYKVSTTH